uniref:Uncharacterized protein n=1 Tax=Arundo donax TaxID=35708 RepID=A0A0A9EJV3_ARUDO
MSSPICIKTRPQLRVLLSLPDTLMLDAAAISELQTRRAQVRINWINT